MSNLFISYAHEDKPFVERLVPALEARHWSIFWDDRIRKGSSFDRVIEKEIKAAEVVLVLWSRHSVDSDWVRNEASWAADRGKLIPIAIERDVEPPLQFHRLQLVQLFDWTPDSAHKEFLSLCAEIASRLTADVPASAPPSLASSAPNPARPDSPLIEARVNAPPLSQRPLMLAIGSAAVVAVGLGVWLGGENREPVVTPPPGASTQSGDSAGRTPAPDPPAPAGAVFSTEIVDAGAGESFLVHYGSASNPRFVVIDGGQRATYKEVLAPRLNGLKRRWSMAAALPIELAVVTQIDDPNIKGVLDLFEDLVASKQSGAELPFAIKRLWFNGFAMRAPERWKVTARAPQAGSTFRVSTALYRPDVGAIFVAPISVRQGHMLLQRARALNLALNQPFGSFVMLPERGAVRVQLPDGLSVTVLAPARQRLEEFFDYWLKTVRQDQGGLDPGAEQEMKESIGRSRFAETPDLRILPHAATSVAVDPASDLSVVNRASIVTLLEFDGKRMLFSADAGADDIVKGLAQAGLLKANTPFHVDVLHVPHQGSDRNVSRRFFELVTADRYVIGGNGTHGNPESATLGMITEARGDAEYQLVFTHPDGQDEMRKRLQAFFTAEQNKERRYRVVFRQQESGSLKINLRQPVSY